MHARLHTIYGHDVVEAMGQAKVRSVHLFLAQKLLIVGIDGGAEAETLLKLLGAALNRFLVDVTHRGDSEIVQALALEIRQGEHVATSDTTGTDHSQPKFVT